MRDRNCYSYAPRFALLVVAAAISLLRASDAPAQTVSVTEDFIGNGTANPWYVFNGACLTASSSAGTGSATTAGIPPGCSTIQSSYYGENLVGGYNGVAGSATTLPDPTGDGALRFTNGCIYTTSSAGCSNGGHSQNGAIISGNTYSSSAGIQITFKTTTYRGDSLSAGTNGDSDGADGMSFFLMNGTSAPNIGSWGGSLGYTCSNANTPYTGMVGAYIGLGIDEYGNFLNGDAVNSTGTVTTSGDNTASGYGPQSNRIGMRGAGNIAWSYLNALNSTYYPSSLSSSQQQAAVQSTCETGFLWNYSNPGNAHITSTAIMDYPAIPNAYKVLTDITIANEYASGGYSRQVATPIMYKLTITPAGLLSLSYSQNGGSWLGVLSNQSITASNGTLPATIRFGFAGSTGGGSNIHEVLCFKAASLDTSGSSAASNLQQSAQVNSSTQAYFAYYDPNNWTGRLTANALSASSTGALSIATTATWDASCVLTGVASGSSCTTTGVAGPTSAEGPTSRVILSWNGTAGIPFEWTNLTGTQQSTLDAGDSSATAYRLNYLRGDRSEEVTATGTGLYRDRVSVLSDIVDSSPLAVGQPLYPYAITWKDKLVTTDVMSENSGTQSYAQFYTAEQTRENVVYVGANDGLLHGFRAGSYNSSNSYQSGTNDGTEVLAYMPAAVLNTIHNSSNAELDFANTQYGHNFYVDAPPASGDLFYENVWHTWLVGGLGAGGAAIYALDVTNPSNFAETNASSLVIGEWSAANLTCSNVTNCANNLGNTYGTPVIRRLHNGDWAVIFGNGFGSTSGDAGIYIMTVAQATGARTFYYLSTGKSGSSDGIAYVTPVDLDGDHITDYVYAGDLLGNVWRFDLTSASPSSWAASSAPLFSAGTSQPITSSLLIAAVVNSPGTQIMVAFGTGRQFPLTNSSGTTYAAGTQALYAVWDWNFSTWNSGSSVQYASLNTGATNFSTHTGLSSPYTLAASNLTAQVMTLNSSAGTVDMTTSAICWAGTTLCSSNKSFGWYANLIGASEQVIYNPELVGNAFVVNSVIPANNSVLACTANVNSGFTYAINLSTGGVSTSTTTGTSGSSVNQNFFVNNTDSGAVGVQTNATGSGFIVTTATGGGTSGGSGGSGGSGSGTGSGGGSSGPSIYANPFSNVAGCSVNQTYLVYQTSSGTGNSTRVAPSCPLSGNRVTWSQRR